MPRRPLLEFEKPLVELEQQIEQIRQLARDSEVDVSQQLHQLESLAARRRQEIFQSLTPAQKIQVARHPHRPSTLDFIQMFCETGSSSMATAVAMTTRPWWAVSAVLASALCCSSATRRDAIRRRTWPVTSAWPRRVDTARPCV